MDRGKLVISPTVKVCLMFIILCTSVNSALYCLYKAFSVLDLYPKLPKVLQFYPFYAYQGNPKRPYVYLRCLFSGKKRDSTVKYLFYLYKIKQGQDGKILKNVVHRKETTRRYFDVRLMPERYPVGLGDMVNFIAFFVLYSSSSSKMISLENGDWSVRERYSRSCKLYNDYTAA